MKTHATIRTLAQRSALTQADMLKRVGGRFGWRFAVALALTLLAVSHPAHAQDDGTGGDTTGAAPRNSEIGHAAHAWLAIQRSNSAAAPAQPMLGAEAGYAYKRYLKSFDTEIPATFGSSVKSGGTTGGGQSNGTSGGAY